MSARWARRSPASRYRAGRIKILARTGSAQEPRHCSAREAAELVRSEDTCAVPLGPGQPASFLHALGERESFESLTVFAALLMDLYPLFARPGVRLLSGFFGPVERALQAAGHRVEFIPSDFRGFAKIARQLEPRVMATAVAPPDAAGKMSLSLHAGATVEELQRCAADPERLLIAEINPKLPRTFGLPPEHPHALETRDVDVILEGDRDVAVLDDPPAGAVERAIAQHARRFIAEGATLQTGIGAIPSGVAKLLAEDAGGDYGIHSEMFTSGLMRLQEAGKVSNRGTAFEGFSIATFALGSAELYRWLDERADVRFLPVSVVNDPSLIARNRQMVSINGAIALDLFGQMVADHVEDRQYSGIGGHEDFITGASLAVDGRSLVCLPSTSVVDGKTVSRIWPRVPERATVTTPRHHLDVVVTEYGAAEVSALPVGERARRLIEVAHPDFRDALREELKRWR